MRKLILITLIFIAVGNTAMAQEKEWHLQPSEDAAEETNRHRHSLSLAASFGFLSGRGEEIVYINSNSDNKLSELLWMFEPVLYAGADISYSWRFPSGKMGIFADASIKFGIPSDMGVMEDRDWTAVNPNFLTHYSVHEKMKTETAMHIDAAVGMSFSLTENLLIKPLIFYSFMLYRWSAPGGSFLYPPLDRYGNPLGHFYDYLNRNVITYEQAWHILGAGVSLNYRLNKWYYVEPFFKISPAVLCYAIDEHILRNLTVTEYLLDGLFLGYGFSFYVKPTDFFTIALNFAGRNLFGTRGNSTYDEVGEPRRIYGNIGGAGYTAFDINISARFTLF